MESKLIDQLISRQRPPTEITNNRMSYQDFMRLVKYIDQGIFNKLDQPCVLWKGTTSNKAKPAQFTLNSKKFPINRLLYHNFVAPVTDQDQIVYTCGGSGKCYVLSHMKKEPKKTTQNNTVLSNTQIAEIYLSKFPRKTLAENHKVSVSTIRNIQLGLVYVEITQDLSD